MRALPPRLGIVIPYRNRADHLASLVPHIKHFFRTDDSNKDIPCRIAIVEQTSGLPFNRGSVCNIGYKILCHDVDYICFHDVDFLPVIANYRWPNSPTMVIHHGFEFQPVDHEDPQKGYLKLPVKELFSAVVLLQKDHFEQANGFPNDYWGWGYEDVDLRNRLLKLGFRPEHREGTFTRLLHPHVGCHLDGTPTDAKLRNGKLFVSRWNGPGRLSNSWKCDGLNTLAFKEIGCQAGRTCEPGEMKIDHVVVELGHRPPEWRAQPDR
jgi:hypothetical protein